MDDTATQLIDVHAHFVAPRYVAAAQAAGHRLPDGMPAWPHWDAAAHLELMDRGRIRTSILSVSSPGTHFGDDPAARALTREVNEYAAALVRDHPERFAHFASLPLPDVEGSLAELAYALDVLGSDGVALESNAHGGGTLPLLADRMELFRTLFSGTDEAPEDGSDYCFTPAAGSLAQISSLDSVDQPPGDSWRALTSRNAVRLLPHRA